MPVSTDARASAAVRTTAVVEVVAPEAGGLDAVGAPGTPAIPPGGPPAVFPAKVAPPVTGSTSTTVEIGGRTLLTFGGCDYLGLSHHPAVIAAAADALRVHGVSTTASRVTTGNTLAHNRLEEDVARLLGQDAAVVVPEGYTANLALCQALSRRIKVALIDERAHRSLHDSAFAAGLRVVRYANRDPLAAARRLDEIGPEPVAILTDGVFTADGAIAPVPALLACLRDERDVLVVDDCHGVGVLGEGRGTCRWLGVADPSLVVTTTLAKGIGCYGGAVAGPAEVVEEVRRHATAFICTTAVPPAIAAAASAAIRVLEHDRPRHARLLDNARNLRDAIRSLGIDLADQPTPIAAFVFPGEESWREAEMQRVQAGLLEAGILAPLIRYPGGPASRYFRLTVTAEHTAEQIERLRVEMGRLMR